VQNKEQCNIKNKLLDRTNVNSTNDDIV